MGNSKPAIILHPVRELAFDLGVALQYRDAAHKEIRGYAVAPSELRHAELLARRQSTAGHPLALSLPVILPAAGFAIAFMIPDPAGHAPLFGGWNAIVARWTQVGALADSRYLLRSAPGVDLSRRSWFFDSTHGSIQQA
jgi:hypothetical protein